MTTPDTAEWHASEEGQQDRRLIATEDKTALWHLVDPPKPADRAVTSPFMCPGMPPAVPSFT